MTPPALVLFDCDGVLVDTEPPAFEVLLADLSARGFHSSLDDLRSRFLGGTMRANAENLRDAGVDIPENWVDEMYGKIYARLRTGVLPIPGIPALLDRLDAAGLAYAVGSNGRPEKMEISLTSAGLWPRLQGRCFSAQVVGEAKPAPDVYLAAAAHYGIAPSDCVVIEDSPTGAAAARAANMRCFGYAPQTATDADGNALSAAGARIFGDMAALPALLGLPKG